MEYSIILSMFTSLPYCVLDMFATGKRVKNGHEQGLKIPGNIYAPDKSIKLAKKQNKNNRRKLKRNCKTFCNVTCIQIFCIKCLIWPVIGRFRYREVGSVM